MTKARRGQFNRKIVPLTVVVLVLIGVSYSQIEWVKIDADPEITEQARRNPFFAAKKFLQPLGVQLRTEYSLKALDQPLTKPATETGDTMVLVDAYGSLSAQQVNHLLDWVNQGGHLIAAANYSWSDDTGQAEALAETINDELFAHFGVQVIHRKGLGLGQRLWELLNSFGFLTGRAEEELCPLLQAQAQFQFADTATPVDAHFLTTDSLVPQGRQPDAWIGIAEEAKLLQFAIGEGMVTLVSSLDWWRNSAIACLDHAFILQRLAPASGVMTWYINLDYPSAWKIVWRYFDGSIITSLLLLAAWLWHRAVRFGPIKQPGQIQQRQLLEHIDASANFLWRFKKAEVLVRSVRSQLLQSIQQRHPQLVLSPYQHQDRRQQDNRQQDHDLQNYSQQKKSPQQKPEFAAAIDDAGIKQLAALAGLSVAEVKLALCQPVKQNPELTTDMLALLQKLKDRI